ncbi:hypothetical protein G6O69_26215 [Pseudenhygromyxa sp. WMMC2535]|uniref:hypothetical protein n=1 Tax=Pseudenhygromyxa sp. WMMC2535 TaxID=2712867 RepID=UPI001555E1BD|nr:hypothetical protein [Pseudenhygromyxa sp. WMMC2535]NVB41360.1 hypothetical protein [Pseudenhygromyxa sp. WMMC2535]
MLIVTGTKRSGTSMWMQILIAAGFPPFGDAFPSNWGETIRAANPAGFYESLLRQGIYWRTNPHPRTGAYFFPEQVERHVVKVFIPGLVRSDRAFIGKVVATVRDWREYDRSITRLYAMEDAARRERKPDSPDPVRFAPALEWWSENFALVRDIAIRRYPVHVQSYDGLLADPPAVIRKTLTWLDDPRADLDAAIAAVKPEHRTQRRDQDQDQDQRDQDAAFEAGAGAGADRGELEPEYAAIFDALYQTIHASRGLERGFIQRLNEINRELVPRIHAAQQAVQNDQLRRQAARLASAETRDDPDAARRDESP